MPEQKTKEAELEQRCESRGAVMRTVQGNFRAHCFDVFGGLAWLKWFFAVGHVTQEIIDLAQTYINERIKETENRPARKEPRPNPRLSEPVEQKRRGVPEEEIIKTGVRHRKNLALQARKYAKWLKKQVDRAESDYKMGKYKGTARAWKELLREFEDIGVSGMGK